ncbi:MAG: molybdopterin-dependent oxidoreductase [Myxococcota bacterium]
MRISRRGFLAGWGASVLMLNLSTLAPRRARTRALAELRYDGPGDVWRARWRWDRVVRGTHNRANCISACSWNLFVKEGVVWREEQNAIYQPTRADLPDFNPRGCQKGACYSDLQLSASRVLYPLQRDGPRGSGRWKRIPWERALTAIADGLIDAAVADGTETIVHDHGTTNIDFGPDTAGEMRLVHALGATVLDSWAGVGDMPMGAVQTWGLYNCEGTSDDWFRSDYIIVWVGNPAFTRIPEVHFMHEARYRGARLIVIAPDLNATAIHADLWLAPRAQSDAAVALSMAQVIVSEGRYEAEYVREQTDLPILVRDDDGRFLREADLEPGGRDDLLYFWDETRDRLAAVPGCQGEGGRLLRLGRARPALEGRFSVRTRSGAEVSVRPVFARLREHLEGFSPERVERVTGLSPPLVRRVARELAAAPSAMIFSSWGACKHYHSDLFQRAMILLMALTGNQGRPGGGLRVAAWWAVEGFERIGAAEPHIPWSERLRLLLRSLRGLTPRDFERFFVDFSRRRAITPLMPFLYVHGGYDALWSQKDRPSDGLPRPLDRYLSEAIERGWIPIHPPPGHRPRVLLFTGSNPLRRWPAPQRAHEHLWPRLDLIVAVNFRMSTSALAADYILPAAAYYEKYGVKYAQTYVPYLIVAAKAVEPLGEARPEWEIFGRLARRIQERARERDVPRVRGPGDEPVDLSRIYDHWSRGGDFNPEDPKGAMDEILRRTPIIGGRGLDESLRVGAVRITSPGLFTPIHQTASDYRPDEPYGPHRWFVEGKLAWPTLTGRQQFYIDHPWYLEVGESLPVHKEPPAAADGYPLRMYGGHTRWSIHAIWRDHELMLRLQRGEPFCLLNPSDARRRGIQDMARVRIRGSAGACELLAKPSPSVQPGQVIVYHAWEPYQFAGWRGSQNPVESPWKPLHLAGGYGQLHYRMYYGAPGHGPRGAPIEVERVGGESA